MNHVLRYFVIADRIIVSFLNMAVVILGLFVAAAIVAGIVARSILDISVFGSEELILIAAMWLYMFGATLASRERSHLGGDFVQAFIKNQKVVHAIQVLAAIISLCMAIFFLACALVFVSWSYSMSPVTPVFDIPLYIPQASLLAASLFMCAYAIKDLVKDIKTLRGI